ncbi:MAG: hypothetical protein JO257_00655 [Deltaproteobacteria bacterium]|nr:hypothetical protein [Deltaproteobacteria bacterium]
MITQLMRAEGDVLVAMASPGIAPLRIAGHASTALALVDIEDGRATFVRPLAPPHPTDLARLQAELAAFARAGYPDVIPDPAAALATALDRLALPAGRPLVHDHVAWDPRAFVLGRFLFQAAERDELYPLTFWEDVPAIGLEELEAQLEAHLVRPKWSRRQLLAPAADRHAYVARWIAAANERLAEVLSPYRMCGPFELHDEPMWLWAEPAAYETLVRERLLRSA